MAKRELIFSEIDYRGKEIIFTCKKWEQKRIDHPELNKRTFVECIKRAIIKPDKVWEDYSDRKNKRCYYKKYSMYTYAKVVVWITSKPGQIVTAYEINYIKESDYPDLKNLV